MNPAGPGEVGNAVRSLMDGFPAPWCVAGGWAADLFLGRATREHGDVELAVFRQDQAALHRHFPGWTFRKVVDGRHAAWPADERLALPVHEVHGRPAGDSRLSLEFLLNEREAGDWAFRRNTDVRLPLARAIRRAGDGTPVLCPAIVLLYKAKGPRPKDEADFRSVRDALDREDRLWLWSALRACHPGHPWIDELGPPEADRRPRVI